VTWLDKCAQDSAGILGGSTGWESNLRLSFPSCKKGELQTFSSMPLFSLIYVRPTICIVRFGTWDDLGVRVTEEDSLGSHTEIFGYYSV
jgi:hypothetical protein